MSQLNSNQSEELRHERKFLITDYSAKEVEQFIHYHPACFREIYKERRINNIYFDSPGFDSYYENVEGNTDRTKVRIRWYNNLFGKIDRATLEFKIKKGLLGKKNFYTLGGFTLNEDFSKDQIIRAMAEGNVPQNVRDFMLSLQPSLLNSYVRKYFISADKKFRVTVDKELVFYRISYLGNTFSNKVTHHNSVVLELKYDALYEDEAKETGSNFPFTMTKNSKYLQGINSVLF